MTGSKQPIENVQAELDSLLTDEAGPLRTRLELETRVENQTVSPAERRDLIAEPINSLEYALTRRLSGGAYKAVTTLAQIGLTIAAVCAVVGWCIYANEKGDTAVNAFVFSLIATVVTMGLLSVLVFRSVVGGRRVTARHFVPRIAQSLSAMSPSAAELEQALATLRARGLKIAKCVEASQLVTAMETPARITALAA